jgi:predicted phage-related endonuclease
LYNKLDDDFRSLEQRKKDVVLKEKNEMKEHDLKILKHYNLTKIKPLCFINYDFKDFKSSYFSVFAQDLLNNQIEVSSLTQENRSQIARISDEREYEVPQ